MIYAGTTGLIPDPRNALEMHAILDSVARAVSKLVPVYAADAGSGVPTALAPLDLIEGQFSRGARLFTLKGGKSMRGLTIQRRDIAVAITVFKSAQISFRQPARD